MRAIQVPGHDQQAHDPVRRGPLRGAPAGPTARAVPDVPHQEGGRALRAGPAHGRRPGPVGRPPAGKLTLEASGRPSGSAPSSICARRRSGSTTPTSATTSSPSSATSSSGKLTPSTLRCAAVGLRPRPAATGKPLAPRLGGPGVPHPQPGPVGRGRRRAARPQPLRGRQAAAGSSEPMRFLSHDEVATLADAIDDPGTGPWCSSRPTAGSVLGELGALRRQARVDLHAPDHHRRRAGAATSGGHHVAHRPRAPPAVDRSRPRAGGRRRRTTGGLLQRRERLVFPAPEGGYLRLENFRRRSDSADVAAGSPRSECTTCATRAPPWRSPPAPTSKSSSACSATPRRPSPSTATATSSPAQAQSVADRLDEMAQDARNAVDGRRFRRDRA